MKKPVPIAKRTADVKSLLSATRTHIANMVNKGALDAPQAKRLADAVTKEFMITLRSME